MKAWLCAVLWIVGLAACGTGGDNQPYDGYESEVYSSDSWWLCRPGLEVDHCRTDLTAVELLPDGSHREVTNLPADDPQLDCFYVYPTMAWDAEPGNHDDPTDIEWILQAVHSQAARFSQVCRLYVPYYRQATLGCYLTEGSEPYLDFAYRDVLEAFRHYMGQYNRGRKVVIMGHSQGTQHLIRLMREEFDRNPALRELLALGLLIGFDAYVPDGESIGGSFMNLPLCTSAGESGCIVAYNSFSTDFPPESPGWNGVAPPAGMTSACAHPAALGGGPARFSASIFPRDSVMGSLQFDDQTDARFVIYRDFYSGQCTRNASQFSYLAVEAAPGASDTRENPIPFESLSSTVTVNGEIHETGLHLLDYFFAQGDLIELVSLQ